MPRRRTDGLPSSPIIQACRHTSRSPRSLQPIARSKDMDQDTSSQHVDIYGRSTDFIKTREIDISYIAPNPHQPRKSMNAERLEELTNSIHTLGLINPIT